MTNGFVYESQGSSDVVSSVVSSRESENVSFDHGLSTQRPSRPRHRRTMGHDHQLNTTFVDSKLEHNTRICDIRKVEENLRMESRMLNQNNNVRMARCSTPSPAYCFHCDHQHGERCCLYVGDTVENGVQYARWMRDLEGPNVPPQHVSKIPEAVSGNTTPVWFPAYTYTKPEEIQQKMMEKHQPVPPVWLRQYYYPLIGYGHEHNLMNQVHAEQPSPYQQYLQQQRQQEEVAQGYFQPPLTEHGCQHGQGKCVIQQFHAHHIHNAPYYVQQFHQAPYYQGSYYSNNHHQSSYIPQAQHPVMPATPAIHEGYLQHHFTSPTSYPVVQQPPPDEVRTPTSTPLWMLFCQKLSRKPTRNIKQKSPTKTRLTTGNHHYLRSGMLYNGPESTSFAVSSHQKQQTHPHPQQYHIFRPDHHHHPHHPSQTHQHPIYQQHSQYAPQQFYNLMHQQHPSTLSHSAAVGDPGLYYVPPAMVET